MIPAYLTFSYLQGWYKTHNKAAIYNNSSVKRSGVVVGYEIGHSMTSWANSFVFHTENKNYLSRPSVVKLYRQMQECDVF